MDLARLLALLDDGVNSTGLRAVAAWLASTPPLPAHAAPMPDDALFLLLARQLAFDLSGAKRVHVQCADVAALAWLARASVPGTIVEARPRILNGHGTCSLVQAALPEGAKLVSACFSTTPLPGFHPLRPRAPLPEAASYARWMQAAGACLHVALRYEKLALATKRAERCVDALDEHYAGLGAPKPEGVLTLARERCLWRAAELVLQGGALVELSCDEDDAAWAARQLVRFPAGDVARAVAAAVRYPDQPRFHAVYHDLQEDVDYNYLSVPLKAVKDLDLAPLRALAPVCVSVYDAHGVLTTVKRTLPVTMDLHVSFPARVLVLRPWVDWMLAHRDDVDAALTPCSAS